MCGRYVLEGPVGRLLQHFEAELWDQNSSFEWANSYNIAPTRVTPVIRLNRVGERVLIPHQWGLVPHWAKNEKIGAKLNNARAETIFDKPSFRTPVRRFRCLVPASGYYEWQAPEKVGHGKRPWYIHSHHTPYFAMAGICDHWTSSTGHPLFSFAIVTCGAHHKIGHIHDRMPVMIQREYWSEWLDSQQQNQRELTRLLMPSDHLTFYPVEKAVSATGQRRRDDPGLITPVD